MTTESSGKSASSPTTKKVDVPAVQAMEPKRREAQLIIQASHSPIQHPRQPFHVVNSKKIRKGSLPKSAPVSSLRAGGIHNTIARHGHSSEKSAVIYRPTLLKSNRYFNESMIEDDKEVRSKPEPTQGRQEPSGRISLKIPKKSLEVGFKPMSGDSSAKSNLFMYNFIGQKLFRKRSNETLGEQPETSKTLMSLREKTSVGEAAPIFDIKHPNLYAKGYKNPAKKPKGYTYHLPPSLFHSLISNKRYNVAAETKREEKTDRPMPPGKRPSGQLEAFEDGRPLSVRFGSGPGFTINGGSGVSLSRSKVKA